MAGPRPGGAAHPVVQEDTIKYPLAVVSAAHNDSHAREVTAVAVRSVVDHLDPPLPSLIRRGDRVLVKVNMGCSGFRDPGERFTSHPAYVEAIIECLLDCGAHVTLGDDVARTAEYERIWHKTGMSEVSKRTGAHLVDFVQAGGREVRGFLRFPKTHLITNLVFDSDVVVNAANCRSLSTVVLSGAIKNMFGVMLGLRKLRIHNLFPDPSEFARVVVDVHRVARPTVSFLDLTSVIEGQGIADAVRPVGLVLGSMDAVALDTIAARAIGYEELTAWTSIHGNAVGLGSNQIDRIIVRGVNWDSFQKKRFLHPALQGPHSESLMNRTTRRMNNTILRPRPVISTETCSGCGTCANRCPVGAIHVGHQGKFSIDLGMCADCGCCLRVCDMGAVRSEMVGVAKVLRRVSGRLHTVQSGAGVKTGIRIPS
jgi:uncharacterized protein (DUF362 family)/ferredoxin